MAKPGRRALLVIPAVILALTTACVSQAGGKATGGGFIPSSLDPTAKAQFAFTVACLDFACQAQKGSGTYDDKGSNPAFPFGVHMQLTSIVVGGGAGFTFPVPSGPKCAAGQVKYQSADPKVPNGAIPGTATVKICDNSHGSVKVADTFAIAVQTGPFAGYADGAPLADTLVSLSGGQITITLPPCVGIPNPPPACTTPPAP